MKVTDSTFNSNGELPDFAFPGGYPLFYVTGNSDVLCPDCANESHRNRAEMIADGDEEWADAPITDYDINYEDASLFCDNCGRRIEPAYGED